MIIHISSSKWVLFVVGKGQGRRGFSQRVLHGEIEIWRKNNPSEKLAAVAGQRHQILAKKAKKMKEFSVQQSGVAKWSPNIC